MTTDERINEQLAGARRFADILLQDLAAYDAALAKPKTRTAQEIIRKKVMTLTLEAENAGYQPETHGPKLTEIAIAMMVSGVCMAVILMATGVF